MVMNETHGFGRNWRLYLRIWQIFSQSLVQIFYSNSQRSKNEPFIIGIRLGLAILLEWLMKLMQDGGDNG